MWQRTRRLLIRGSATAERRRRGQSLTEFAIVVPLLLLVVFALIDFSRLVFTYISLTNGARELARVVAITRPWIFTDQADTTNTVNAFNNLTVFSGPTTPMRTFSLSPGSGTVSCTSVTSAGCGIGFTVDYVNQNIVFTPITGGGATGGPATYSMSGQSVPSLASYGITADGDYAAVLMIEEGNSTAGTALGFVQVCPLPMTSACALNNLNMGDGGGGTIEVDATYTFHYSPLFQNKLTGIIDASFMRDITVLTTTTRTTGE
jgi:Flp pilus assembly protein TadG